MVEGTPLLRAQMVLSRLEGSNPFLSATNPRVWNRGAPAPPHADAHRMAIPYLAGEGNGWLSRIRLPGPLDPDWTLAPIRVTRGALPARQARRKAPGVARDLITRIAPMLEGLNALAEADAGPDAAQVDQTFDALAMIGAQPAIGNGLSSRPDLPA